MNLKKILSALVASAFAVSSVSISVFADGEKEVASYDELVAALANGDSVVLTSNIVAEGVIDATDADIDLANFTLTLADKANNNFFGESTISNGTISIDNVEVGADCIIGIGDSSNDATLNLEDVNLIGSKYSSAFAVLMVYGEGTLNVTGGKWTLSNELSGAGGVIKNENGAGNVGSVNIKDTVMNFKDISRGITGSTAVLDGVEMTVTGGEHGINGAELTVKNGSVLNISDGAGRALTVTDYDVTVEDSELNFSNMVEGDIRFKTANKLKVDEKSVISECTVYADNVGASINGKTVAGTENVKSTVKVKGGETVVENKIVARIGKVGYETVEEALNAAKAGDEIVIYAEGSHAFPGVTGKKLTIKAAEGVDVSFDFATGNQRSMRNSEVTFENITFNWANANYQGLIDWGKNTYNNCTINGQVFLYGETDTFNNCTFNQTSPDWYNVWTYGSGLATFNECTFNSAGKSVLVYKEHDKNVYKVALNDCTFIATEAVEGKAAVEIDPSLASFGVEINNCTANGFSAGSVSGNSLYNNKKVAGAEKSLMVAVDGELVVEDVNATYAAKNGVNLYKTLQDALDAAVAGDIIVLKGDVTENVVFGDANGIALMSADSVTLDLNGYTLTSADDSASTIVNYKDLIITNGTVEHTNKNYAVSSMAGSKLTVEDATIKGAGAINLLGATAELKNGNYKKSNNTHTGAHVIRTQDANVVIYDGEFTNEIASDDNGKYYGSVLYLKGASNVTVKDGTFTTANESVLIDAQDSTVLNIEGGDFTTEMDIRFYGSSDVKISNGKFDVNKCYLSTTAKVVVTGGLFTNTTDLKSKVDADSSVIDLENGWFKVVETSKITTGVSVYFRPAASDVASEKVYDIVLKAADGQEIYEWETADLTFDLDSDTIVYSIAADDNVTLTKKGDDRYMFSMDGVNEFERTDDLIKIGQVKFAGYGEFSFAVANETTNVVMATEVADSIAKEFTVAGGNLTINGTDIDADGDKEDTDDLLGKIDGEEIKVPTKDLIINVTFNNKIYDKEVAYQDMKVVISGGDLAEDIVKNFGSDENALVNNVYTVEAELTEDVVYNVTVTGAGYRTARYEVKMDANKTLNFWNNVKDIAVEIEAGKEKMNTNFLAGDIVADNVINVYDLSAVVSYFGTESNITNNFVMYDLNRDGMIDSRDVAYVLVSWNK